MNEDAELLGRYATERSESAFAELTRRHVDLIYSAAIRLVGGDGYRAQDVTQQVFSELARQARRLARHPALAGWLYTTTRLMALRATRTEQRRRAREQEANAMNELLREPAPGPEWEHLRPVLDDAMHELGEKDRLAVLLRFFQNKSLKEVGAALGLNENAARMRVERALEKLRAQLARKGVTSTAAALAATLAGHAVAAAPPVFVATLASASLASAAAGTGITLSALELMTMTKLKAGIVGAVAVAGVATTLVIHDQSRSKIREADASLRQQANQLAQLQTQNERLSNLAALVQRPPANSQDELPGLRDEVAALRRQTNGLVALRDKNRQLQETLTKARQDLRSTNSQPTVQSEETTARTRYCMGLALAIMEYASDHQDQFPTNFDQAASFVSARTGKETNLSPSQFEIVYRGSRKALAKFAHPGEILLIRERQPWKNTDGKWVKVYVFSDGGGTVHSAADGNFEAWEKQHIIPPESSKK